MNTIPQIVLTCVLAITTPSGQICIKPDGNVVYPQGVQLDRLSRQMWDELGRTYNLLRKDFCL